MYHAQHLDQLVSHGYPTTVAAVVVVIAVRGKTLTITAYHSTI
jgi:hypothetical protein